MYKLLLKEKQREYTVTCLKDYIEVLLISSQGVIHQEVVDMVERILIETILKQTEGNKVKAARLLGINRNTLNNKIKLLKIDVERFKNE